MALKNTLEQQEKELVEKRKYFATYELEKKKPMVASPVGALWRLRPSRKRKETAGRQDCGVGATGIRCARPHGIPIRIERGAGGKNKNIECSVVCIKNRG